MRWSRKRVVGFFHPELDCLVYTSDHDVMPHTVMARVIHLFGEMEVYVDYGSKIVSECANLSDMERCNFWYYVRNSNIT
ncbi:unnamed protein product [Lupinus luteus]|uniref:Uncharacterized protein n=1 Tax=Lupinus luteus TaxID=3873 RepID=A0AAV1X125_LUPLU